jgi:uncharacterized protein YndB with AHSA1/START domain
MIVLYIILGIVAAVLIAGLFIPKGMTATREIIINKPSPEVFNFIKYLENQQKFSKWASMDPDMKSEMRGNPDGTPGAVHFWTGNKKVGEGEQEILAIGEGKKVDFELRFIKPFKSVAKAFMTTEATGEQSTKVSWGFIGSMNYPLNVMKLLMNMEKSIGNDFQTGLNNLKALMEK